MSQLWWLIPCLFMVFMVVADRPDRRRWRRERDFAAWSTERATEDENRLAIARRACSDVVYDSGTRMPSKLGPWGKA